MGKAYDKFYDFIASYHLSNGKAPDRQQIMDHFELVTEAEDDESILNDSVKDLIDKVLEDYKKLNLR